MGDDFRNKLTEAEKYAREGQSQAAAREVRSWLERPIPRELLSEVARLARRLGLAPLAIRWLAPVVADGTVSETLEYTAALLDSGIQAEAGRWLKTLNESEAPFEIALLQARWLMAQSDAQGAIALFEKYLSGGVAPGSWEAGAVRLELARAQICAGDSAAALSLLQKSAETVTEFPASRSRALETMATAILSFQRDPAAQERLLEEVRFHADRRRDFELVRECDRLRAQATGDRSLWEKLYFGTSSESFRERLVKGNAIKEGDLPEEYSWVREGEGRPSELHLATGQIIPAGVRLKVGQVPHRLVSALCSDFYSDFSAGRLHELVYPGENYHPDFSAPRIYEAVKRLRKWFIQQQLPWTVIESNGRYRITAQSAATIIVSLQVPQARRISQLVDCLKKQWRSNPFSVRDASGALGISPRGTLRLLAQARQSGQLERLGKSRAVLYQFKI